RGRGQKGVARSMLVTALASTAVVLVNPYGVHLLEVPFRIQAALATSGISNPEWGSSFSTRFWLFWVCAAALQWGFYRAWRHGARPSPAVWLSGLVLTVLGAATLRFVAFFFASLPVVVFSVFQSGPEESGRIRTARLPDGVVAGLLALLGAVLFLISPSGSASGPFLSPGRFPEAMARRYRSLGIQGPIYNPVRFGGYLSWRLAPEKVFLDGRNEVHASLLARLGRCRISSDLGCWEGILNRWKVQAAFVEYDPRRIRVRLRDGRFTSMSTASVYFRRKIWALVDWDDAAMLLVRRDGPNRRLAASWEDHLLTPDDPVGFEERLRAGKVDAEAALVEVDRRLKAHPGSLKGLQMRKLILECLATTAHRQQDSAPVGEEREHVKIEGG
ncbi:MAG: hypothetical protein ACE5ID_06805, partial [Acidobacteriota bacterium]